LSTDVNVTGLFVFVLTELKMSSHQVGRSVPPFSYQSCVTLRLNWRGNNWSRPPLI